MATPQLVSEVMTKDVVSVSEDQTLADLLASMRGMHFRHTQFRSPARVPRNYIATPAGLFATTNWVLTPKATDLHWFENEQAAVAQATAQPRPLLIDFRADWCLPCKELEVRVFTHPSVEAALQDHVLLRIDLTREDEDPARGALKTKYHVDTLPAVRAANTTGETLAEVNEFLPPAESSNASPSSITHALPLERVVALGARGDALFQRPLLGRR